MHQTVDTVDTVDETKLSDNDIEDKYKHIFRPVWSIIPPKNVEEFPDITLCGKKQKAVALLKGMEAARSYATCPDCLMKLESYNRHV